MDYLCLILDLSLLIDIYLFLLRYGGRLRQDKHKQELKLPGEKALMSRGFNIANNMPVYAENIIRQCLGGCVCLDTREIITRAGHLRY